MAFHRPAGAACREEPRQGSAPPHQVSTAAQTITGSGQPRHAVTPGEVLGVDGLETPASFRAHDLVVADRKIAFERGWVIEMTWSDPGGRAVAVEAQSGQAVSVAHGELATVVDVAGHQVGDMWAIDATDPSQWLSTSHTRDRCERLFPAVGGQFSDQHGEPILQLVADTSPGLHDMLFPPCDRWLYESRGLPGHPNCRDNFLAALSSAGISLPIVPAPVNLFQNSGPQPDGRLLVGTAASRPGDAITFLAQRDLVFVLTACSVDYPPLNNGHCGPLRIEISLSGRTRAALA